MICSCENRLFRIAPSSYPGFPVYPEDSHFEWISFRGAGQTSASPMTNTTGNTRRLAALMVVPREENLARWGFRPAFAPVPAG